MARNFVVSPEVRRLIGERVFRLLRTSDDYRRVRCAICGETIDSDSGRKVTVSLDTDGETMRLWTAHSRCSPSRVIQRKGLREAVEDRVADTMAVFFTRERPPHGVLAYETNLQVMAGESMDRVRDRTIDIYLQQGFNRVTTDLEDFLPQPARGWALELSVGRFTIRAPNELEAYTVATAGIPPTWLDLVGTERCCLVLTGPSLGLPVRRREDATAAIKAAIEAENVVGGIVVDPTFIKT